MKTEMTNESLLSKLQVLRSDTYYSAPELAKLFRANESTIKRWADSGKLRCFKTPGGHRKFTPEHVSEFISSYQYEIITPNFDFQKKEEAEVLDFLILKADFRTLSEIFFGQAIRAEKENLLVILKNSQAANISLLAIYDDIIGGALRKISRLRLEKRISASEELVATRTMHEVLIQFQMLTKKIIAQQKIAVCGCATSGLDEVFMVCASHLLEIAGWKVYNLGTNLPEAILADAMLKYSPGLVCVSHGYLYKGATGQTAAEYLLGTANDLRTQILFMNFEPSTHQQLELPPSFDHDKHLFSSFRGMLTLAMSRK